MEKLGDVMNEAVIEGIKEAEVIISIHASIQSKLLQIAKAVRIHRFELRDVINDIREEATKLSEMIE